MKEDIISIGDLLRQGWKLTKEHLGFFIAFQVIIFAFTLLNFVEREGVIGVLWGVVCSVIVVLMKIGLYRSSLMIIDGKNPGFDQLYKNYGVFISWVVASFLFSLMFIIGLVLFIVPGLYLFTKYCLFPFFILDKNLGPIEALKKAAQATAEIRWSIFLLLVSCFFLNLLGFFLFGVGMLLTIPVTLLALGTLYRSLVEKIINPELIA